MDSFNGISKETLDFAQKVVDKILYEQIPATNSPLHPLWSQNGMELPYKNLNLDLEHLMSDEYLQKLKNKYHNLNTPNSITNDWVDSYWDESKKKYFGIKELYQNRWYFEVYKSKTRSYKNRWKIKQLLEELTKSVGKDLGGEYTRRGLFWTPPNGFCGWHTNANASGERIYLVWCEEDNKSFFKYEDVNTKKIITIEEKKGWNVNRFSPPAWHCLGSHTNRVSIGFMKEKHHIQGIHPCRKFDGSYGDWRIKEISNSDLFLKLFDIKHLLVEERLQTVNFDDIKWKGKNLTMDKRGEMCICCGGKKYVTCDTKFPGILIKGVSNDSGEKYRMIDGKHRIEKIKYNNIYNSKFYVLEFDEIKKYFKFISK